MQRRASTHTVRPPALPRIALLCDVDQAVYHVGDEAIAEASAAELSRRGFEVVPVSRREAYGPSGTGDAPRGPEGTIRALTFPWPPTERGRYLSEIRRVLAGDHGALPPEDKLFEIIEQLRTVDALVIGGGGSLNSRYGWLLDERLGTALVAASLGMPIVLTGQSLGPALSVTDRRSLGELLDLCCLVGVRDDDSLAIARSLRPDHPALLRTQDDAVTLDLGDGAREDLVSVTLGSDPSPLGMRDYVDATSRTIRALAEATGAPVEFVPHMARPGISDADVALHARVAEEVGLPAVLAPLERADVAARRQAHARWVLSTRFHPVVFGALAGSAVLALPLDRYGLSRIRGALRSAGRADPVFPLGALVPPAGRDAGALIDLAVRSVAAGAGQDAGRRRDAVAALRERAERWWDRVADVIAAAARVTAVPEGARTSSGTIAPDGATTPDASDLPPLPELEASAGEPEPWQPFTTGSLDPLVSIILRTKDRPVLLDRAIQDVLSQTRADWELIVVDDAGEPGAAEDVVARHRHELRGRANVVRREESHGMEAASNAGLAVARGELISIHDDDDTWDPMFLQRTVTHLHEHPEECVAMVRTTVVHEHVEGDLVVEDDRVAIWENLTSLRLSDFVLLNRAVPISLLYRREVHDRLGPFREDLPVVGDYEFNLRLLRDGRGGVIDEPLAFWHLRPRADGTASNSMFAQDRVHREVDLDLAEEHFRAWTRDNGIGLPMFLSRNIGENLERALDPREDRLLEALGELSGRLDRIEGRLDAIEAGAQDIALATEERSAVRLVRRSARSVRTAALLALDRARRLTGR